MRLFPSLTRRGLLAGAGGLALAFGPSRVAFAAGTGDRKLVVVILRGALDGLSLAPPHGDEFYYGYRTTTAIAPPGLAGGALPLNSTFGLHPSLGFLHSLWERGELGVLPACASAYRDRSHFDGQDMLESGANAVYGAQDGWLNRALAALPEPKGALGLGTIIPLILRGAAPVSNWTPSSLPPADPDTIRRLEILYEPDPLFSMSLAQAIATGQIVGDLEGLGQGFEETARAAGRLLAAEGGPSAAAMSFDGWDTHANQGGAQGQLATNLAALDRAMAGLKDELGARWARTAVMIVTEFGRTALQNGTGGTDHGAGSAALLFGGAVRGGRFLGGWPGLSPVDLNEGRDLRPVTDLRSLFKGVLRDHWGVDLSDLNAQVFPDSGPATPIEGMIR